MNRTAYGATWWIGVLFGVVLFLSAPAPVKSECLVAEIHVPAPVMTIAHRTSFPLTIWDWDEFRKYWKKQLGRTTGVVGVACIGMAIAVLIIVTSTKARS